MGWRLVISLAFAQPILAYAIARAEEPLYLSPVVDGVTKNGVVTVQPEKNGIRAKPADLRAIGIETGSLRIGADGTVFFPAHGAVSATVDMQNQVIHFSVPNADLIPSVTVIDAPPSISPSKTATGAFLNYAFSVTPPFGAGRNRTRFSLAGNLTGVVFGRFGFVSSSTLMQEPRPSSGDEAVFTRLNTTYEFDQPEIPRVWRAGDLMTDPPGWGRPEFLGGVQLMTDYSLQPSAITFPTPVIGQSLAEPSDVSLLVNNVSAYRGNADAGPFALVGIPVVNGLNEITVQTRSASGEVITQTVPFYASTTMLKPGLKAYTISLGFIRHNYGEIDNFYATPALDGTFSMGLTDWLTPVAHVEATPHLALLGGGFESSGFWGDLSAALAFSANQKFPFHRRHSGHLFSLQYSRSSSALGFAAGLIKATSGYDDMGIETNATYPVLSWHVSGSAALPFNAGNLALAFTEQSATRHNRDAFVLASYSGQITSRLSFTFSCFQGEVRAFGVNNANSGCNAGVSLAFGELGTLSGSAATGAGQRPEFGETYQHFPAGIEGPGGSVSNFMGDYLSRNVHLQDVNAYNDIAANVAQNGSTNSAEFDLNGSLIAMDGFYFTRPTNQSFAVVDFGYPKVPVFLSNQPVGRTNRSGRMLIPNLIPNYPNQISIDPGPLPMNVTLSDDVIAFTPPREGGALIKFPLHKLDAVLLRIRLAHGGTPAAGSLLYIVDGDSANPVVVGYDGYAYLENPPRHLVATIITTTGHCVIDTNITTSVHDALLGKAVTCE